MKKVAFPTSNRETVDGHFGHTKEFIVYTVNNNKIEEINYLTPPPHEHGVLPRFLAEQDIDVIIGGGMGKGAINLLQKSNIEVILGAKGNLDALLETYLDGNLVSTGSSCNHNHSHGHSHDHKGSCGKH